MDTVKAAQLLEALDEVLVEANEAQRRGREEDSEYWRESQYIEREDEIKRRLPIVRRLLEEIGDDRALELLEKPTGAYSLNWSNAHDAVQRALGILQGHEELAQILGPEGPTIVAAGLHPWVWEAAARLWDQGNRRLAVQNAATTIDNELKAKVNRLDLSGYELVTYAFNPKPPKAGESRLRRPGFVEGTDDWTSAHQGAMAFGQGCILGIRNLATHRQEEPGDQESLELLAALSVLARWIDESSTIQGS